MVNVLPAVMNVNSYVLSTACRQCRVLKHVRFSHRAAKREARKQEVIQFQSETARPANRVYVWGYAATGALGINI